MLLCTSSLLHPPAPSPTSPPPDCETATIPPSSKLDSPLASHPPHPHIHTCIIALMSVHWLKCGPHAHQHKYRDKHTGRHTGALFLTNYWNVGSTWNGIEPLCFLRRTRRRSSPLELTAVEATKEFCFDSRESDLLQLWQNLPPFNPHADYGRTSPTFHLSASQVQHVCLSVIPGYDNHLFHLRSWI